MILRILSLCIDRGLYLCVVYYLFVCLVVFMCLSIIDLSVWLFICLYGCIYVFVCSYLCCRRDTTILCVVYRGRRRPNGRLGQRVPFPDRPFRKLFEMGIGKS